MFARKMYADANAYRIPGSSWTLLNVPVMRVSMFGYCLEVRSNVKYIHRGPGERLRSAPAIKALQEMYSVMNCSIETVTYLILY